MSGMGFEIDAAALRLGEKAFRQPCKFIAGSTKPDNLPPPDAPEIAFAGRSNVGKSSLINALTGQKALARASKTPGRTQQINFFELGEALRLVDLPGYGFAVASKQKIAAWNGLIRAYLKKRFSLKRVCVLVDARHGLKDVDTHMMKLLDEAGVQYLIILTKTDKVKPPALAALKTETETVLKKHPSAFPVVYDTSSVSGAGLPELRAILISP